AQSKFAIKLSGTQNGQSKNWDFINDPITDSTAYTFVTPLWAKMKIDDLLIQLRDYELNTSEAKRIINKIVYLGLKYSIITPYTSYIDEITTSTIDDNPCFEIPALPHLPKECHLEQNFPNPFNAETSINFTIFQYTNAQIALLTIYNLLGEKIMHFFIPISGPGNYQIKWDGLKENGQPIPTGVYFYQLQIGKKVWQRKLLLLK
ncbi:T9SS type A sorting domain-containing protein, partial [candidate division KSB1 bacterium]|nr:T9SS type A sorting domain-containing protein [candidate division KSB1 bacterium]